MQQNIQGGIQLFQLHITETFKYTKIKKESSDNKLVKNSRNEATLLTFIKQSTYVTSPLSSTVSKSHIRIYISATPSTADDTSWGKINYRNFLLHDVYFARRASEIHMKP